MKLKGAKFHGRKGTNLNRINRTFLCKINVSTYKLLQNGTKYRKE